MKSNNCNIEDNIEKLKIKTFTFNYRSMDTKKL